MLGPLNAEPRGGPGGADSHRARPFPPRRPGVHRPLGRRRRAIELVPELGDEALAGLEDFSHVEIVFWFHEVTPRSSYRELRRPRGRADLPAVGVFAARGPSRPNPLGVTICAIVDVGPNWLSVRGLDAIDGTPVVDLKPVMSELLPAEVRQPDWSRELMRKYFTPDPSVEINGAAGLPVVPVGHRLTREDVADAEEEA